MSFSVSRGETVAVIGESGCGKATLARMLLRLSEPDGGETVLKGATFPSNVERNYARSAVMRAGQFLKAGEAELVLHQPKNAHTRELRSAVPELLRT